MRDTLKFSAVGSQSSVVTKEVFVKPKWVACNIGAGEHEKNTLKSNITVFNRKEKLKK